MTRKARIFLDPGTRRWTVQLPGFGFGRPQCLEFDDQPSALRWVDRRIQRSGSLAGTAERVNAPRVRHRLASAVVVVGGHSYEVEAVEEE